MGGGPALLTLAEGLKLPVEVATQTVLVVGKRGSGKTSTGVRLAEQLHAAGIPFVVLDPVDCWWGLKASRTGERGLPVYVFGGRHGDLPLEPTAGALMADVAVDHRISMVLSIRHFTDGERARFVTDFAERLFRRNTEPLHLFLEEAHEVAPQRPYKGEERMLHYVHRIWKLGRNSGLGGSAITQRPASLNKNVTTQAEILVIHRTIGPQDVAAIRGWIQYHGEREDILAELATLKTGEAFIWAPDFPEDRPIGLKRVRILPRETFDSSATPRSGERRQEPKELAPVDLEKLRARMAATLERAKQEDPRELRRRIAQLEAERKEWQRNAIVSSAKETRVEVPILKDQQIDRLVKHYARMVEEAERHGKAMSLFWRHQAEEATAVLNALRALSAGQPSASVGALTQRIRADQAGARTGRVTAIMVSRKTEPGLTGPEQRILNAIAWSEGIGIETPAQVAVAFLAGYTYGGGAFNNPKGALRTKGLVEYVGERIRLTAAGRAVATPPPDRLSVADLHGLVLSRLPTPERRILAVLLECYPSVIDKEILAEKAGYTPAAGAFNNPLGRLRSLGLIDYPQPGRAVAKGLLFLEAGA